jgi:hypothetical protein
VRANWKPCRRRNARRRNIAADPKLRNEFATEAQYVAFRKAELSGLVKLQRKRFVRRAAPATIRTQQGQQQNPSIFQGNRPDEKDPLAVCLPPAWRSAWRHSAHSASEQSQEQQGEVRCEHRSPRSARKRCSRSGDARVGAVAYKPIDYGAKAKLDEGDTCWARFSRFWPAPAAWADVR